MSVTIVTITQLSRINNFIHLKNQIISQTHQPKTWIIVNGSKNDEDAMQLELFLEEQNIKNIVDDYIYISRTDRSFANMHNDAFLCCNNEYVTLMEDDEYYQPTYLENNIMALSNSDKMIAGCSKIYLWDENDEQLYKWCYDCGEGHTTMQHWCLRHHI